MNLKEIAEEIKKDIDAYCVKAYDDGHRTHLGASLIGRECSRYLWYVFRWCFKSEFDGRMYRLFNRGHREEERFIEWLKGIGAQVWELDPETGKQIRISGVDGHYGGSLDAAIILPEKYGISEPVLGEFKTMGTGAAFRDLCKKGVALQKPQHFAQMNQYGTKKAFRFALYFTINKNDDDLYIELVKLSHDAGNQLEMKAASIISSQEAPPKLSTDPTFHKCCWCDARKICHGDQEIEKNCRSCKHARPVANAEWACEAHGQIIPKDQIGKVHPCHESINR